MLEESYQMVATLFRSPVLASWFAAGVTLFNSIIAIPIVISILSVEEINVWFLFFSVVALAQGVQFGFNGTFVRFIAYSNSGVRISEFASIKDLKKISTESFLNIGEFSTIIGLTKYVYGVLSIIFFILILLLGNVGLSSPIGLLENPSEGWVAWFIVVFVATMVIYLGHYRIFLEGTNHVVTVQRVLAIVNLVGLGAILSVLILKPTLVAIVLVYQVVALISALVIAFIAKRKMSSTTGLVSSVAFDQNLFSIIWESVWKSGITVLIASSVKHASAILVAQWFPVGESASYQFTKRLFDVIENFVQITFQAKLPLLASLRGKGDFMNLLPALAEIQRISFSVFLIGYLTLLLIGDPILSLIGSNVEVGGYTLLVLFSFSTFFSRWSGIMLAISNQSNNVIEHKSAIIVASIFFPLIYLFYEDFGVEIVPFCTLLALLFAMPIVIKQAYSTIHTNFFTYELTVTIPFLLALLLINVSFYFLVGIQLPK
ncbi:MAG: hypothetical protein HRU06_12820 [Oceanospirillaceae bacterium]|nr:hypothetical protein [Oceanospirillaceae bacterium]